MSKSRRALLFASLLLVLGEGASLSLTLHRFEDRRAEVLRLSRAQANAILPSVGNWIRKRGSEETTRAAWLEPFDELTIQPSEPKDLDAQNRNEFASDGLGVLSRPSDRAVLVFGHVTTDHGREIFRLTQHPTDEGTAMDGLLLVQHGLILGTVLLAAVLAVMARDKDSNDLPAFGAYEEAMHRLRQRDFERSAAFERERAALTMILRDRETMARAGELTAGIVHEVRNSLGVIGARAKLLEGSGDERADRGAVAIAEEIRTLQSVMARFLDFIRTEEVRFAAFDLGALVSRVVERESTNHDARLAVEGSDSRVTGDEDLLERSIENVIRNACQAAGPSGHVWVKFGTDATHAFVLVDDDGPGIENVERALRPFESARAGGLGLGLPLALKILSLHHGTLDFARRPGGGTQTLCRWPKMESSATSSNA